MFEGISALTLKLRLPRLVRGYLTANSILIATHSHHSQENFHAINQLPMNQEHTAAHKTPRQLVITRNSATHTC